MDRRSGSHMNGNRNGYNNTANNNSERGTFNNSRPTRFSAKRSRSRSPIRSTYGGISRFDSRDTNGTQNYGNDYKRPRTDTSHSSHVNLLHLEKKH